MDPVIASSLVSGAGGIFGTMMQNSANKDLQASANDANARLAAENRSWQEMMSNTAHQREMADLKKAGLNPILAVTKGGASTPSGNAATAGAARMENVIGSGLSSAKDAYLTGLQSKSTEAEVALKQASTAAQAAQAAQSVSNAKNIDMDTNIKEANMHRLGFESRAWDSAAKRDQERNELERKQISIDKKALIYDNIINRAEQATGVVTNLIPAIKLKTGNDNSTLKRENKTMKDYINRKQGR